jgi:hypothetical protein
MFPFGTIEDPGSRITEGACRIGAAAWRGVLVTPREPFVRYPTFPANYRNCSARSPRGACQH